MDMTSLTKMLLTGAGGGSRVKSLQGPDRLKILLTLIQGGQLKESDLPPELKALLPQAPEQMPLRRPPPDQTGGSATGSFG